MVLGNVFDKIGVTKISKALLIGCKIQLSILEHIFSQDMEFEWDIICLDIYRYYLAFIPSYHTTNFKQFVALLIA